MKAITSAKSNFKCRPRAVVPLTVMCQGLGVMPTDEWRRPGRDRTDQAAWEGFSAG